MIILNNNINNLLNSLSKSKFRGSFHLNKKMKDYVKEKGLDKILKKVGEESTEMVIAAKNGVKEETVGEICDLIYHTLVMMVNEGITCDDVDEELRKRAEKAGNLKKFHVVDKNS